MGWDDGEAVTIADDGAIYVMGEFDDADITVGAGTPTEVQFTPVDTDVVLVKYGSGRP